jgi:two-component system, sensor histidine kinase and response regulator
LTKPVRARELKECLDRVLASEARDWHLAGQPIITRNSLTDAYGDAHYGGRVLLVEDNPVNQQVAQKCVERLGCQVFVVDDGLAGVNAFKEGNYELILMDMQMPVMDGIAATKAIRALERGGKHTPIVALTANVMAGQLERCLEAGMDDFLAKPLDVRRLRDVLDRFGLASGAAHLPLPPDPEAPVDFARIESIAGDDKGFIDELFRAFIEGTTDTLNALRDSLAKRDFAAAAREAHKLKGASGNIGANRLQELARQLEASAVRSDAKAFVQELEATVSEAQRVQEFMEPYLQ